MHVRTVRRVWNPWRHLADLVHIRVRFHHPHQMPPGTLGQINHDTAEITLATGMSQAQRRSVLAHELVHHDRGPVPAWATDREEAATTREAARRLISFDQLAGAMLWCADEHELADELWVDVPTAIARLESLTPGESQQLADLLVDAERHIP